MCSDPTPVVCFVFAAACAQCSSSRNSEQIHSLGAWTSARVSEARRWERAAATPGCKTVQGKRGRDGGGWRRGDDDMKKRRGWRRGAESTACFTCGSGTRRSAPRGYMLLAWPTPARTHLCVYVTIRSNHPLGQVNTRRTSYTACLQLTPYLFQRHIKYHSYLKRH